MVTIVDERMVEAVMGMGALGYGAERIADLLGVSAEEVRRDLEDADSDLAKALKKGADRHAFAVDRKLLERAASGDMAAIKEVKARRARNAREE